MKKQLIIAVGREFGSGGHVIAEALSQRFGLTLYDNNILKSIALESNASHDEMRKYDERPKNRLFSRTVHGHSTSMSEHVANLQFDFLRKKADAGESFIIVGRCAENVLKYHEALVSVFILGDKEEKIKRVMNVYGVTESEAISLAKKTDAKRKSYHNDHCSTKWGDSRNYEFSINSSKLGIEKTVNLIEAYIRQRIKDSE